MISKKAQSEIITTVLIILLVLAAIVIVWQVVQGTLKNTQTDIDDKSDCIGLELNTLQAVAAKGTCTYTDAGAPGSCADTTLDDQANGACPTVTGCNLVSFTQTTDGKVTIRREGTSSAKGIHAQLLINGIINKTDDTLLDESFSSVNINIPNLAVDQEIQVAPLLAKGTPCTLTTAKKVTVA